jgi:ferredoxin
MTSSTITEENDPYRELQEHLDQLPIPYQTTNSGVEINILKRIFTPEEARIASKLRFSWSDLENLDSIYKKVQELGYSKDELEQTLDAIAAKGGVMVYEDNAGNKCYGNAMLIFGMFEFQVNKLTKEFVKDVITYMKEGWVNEVNKVPIPQMRVIPIGVTVDQQTAIFTYDDVKKIIDEAEGPFMITNCICRQAQDVLDRPCKNTDRREVCMAWGKGAEMYSKAGWGRTISKEEAIDILTKNEKEGMILQVGNAQHPEFICSCCSCCDPSLSFLKSLPAPATFIQSNYFATNDQELCTGCGTCADRCQMAAITVVDDKAAFNKNRCIGCGNCVATCPSDAVRLVKKDWETIPPQTMQELYDTILKEKSRVRAKEMKRKEKKALKNASA